MHNEILELTDQYSVLTTEDTHQIMQVPQIEAIEAHTESLIALKHMLLREVRIIEQSEIPFLDFIPESLGLALSALEPVGFGQDAIVFKVGSYALRVPFDARHLWLHVPEETRARIFSHCEHLATNLAKQYALSTGFKRMAKPRNESTDATSRAAAHQECHSLFALSPHVVSIGCVHHAPTFFLIQFIEGHHVSVTNKAIIEVAALYGMNEVADGGSANAKQDANGNTFLLDLAHFPYAEPSAEFVRQINAQVHEM